MKTFTQEHYTHLKENSFNPRICSECQEIDAILKNLPDTISDLYEACKLVLADLEVDGGVVETIKKLERALAKAEQVDKF